MLRSILGSFLTLPIINRNYSNILHITDTHLFANDQSKLLGIDSNASFRTVIREIENRKSPFDLIVATGDFVQDGSKQAYRLFAEQIQKFNLPCVWLAGNHDNYHDMHEIFADYQLAENKIVLLGDKWLLVLLNSQVVDQAYGFLPQSELEFLQCTLTSHDDRYAFVFLHHHAIESGCHWLDQHILKNKHELEEIIKHQPNIKGVAWGHIHQSLEYIWHGCKAFSTPSTCVQFMPKSYDFKLSYEAPGWREIKLSIDGTIQSKVHRIADNCFQPDMSQNGY
ncbi:3',5'-cyclic-AMP phosphodiesterase [Gilliamella sp. B2717]|uniref:3',5'-cyclic-AMP phosphodiesterase n=1 Tax=Gilliamella sp. B3817 TaxID=2818001 RepID=UPI00226A5D64|nr:3',5'-cyclic-AMP phosphodiesterase [Gilliamella sp. B3817]MCX8578375.1 3',5'-cyclic-AMP phosphodiesterase [Gilliamella sp. B2717]